MNKVFIILTIIVILAIFFNPLGLKDLGQISIKPQASITVLGEATTNVANKIATYDVGVSVTSDEKEKAVAQVNQTINKITDDLKTFGIPSSDIKTSNVSVYQQQEYYYDKGGIQKSRPGQWSVSNSAQVKLKDITKADQLTDLLFSTGATNVYGPNFSIDNTNESKKSLYKEAFQNAKTKAELLAKESGKKLGKVVSIATNNAQVNPMYFSRTDGIGGGGGAKLEQGTSSVSVSMTVVFELVN